MLSIGKFIYSRLSGLTSISSISPVVAVTGSTDFLVYKRTGVENFYTNDGICQTKTNVEIDIVTDNYFDSVEIAEDVLSNLEVSDIVYAGHRIFHGRLTGAGEDFNNNLFVQTLYFEFVSASTA